MEDDAAEEDEVLPPGNAGPVPKVHSAGAVDKAKKGKLNAKSTGLKYQFQIMLAMGVPREDIKKFADPYHWLTFFPPITIVRMSSILVLTSFLIQSPSERFDQFRCASGLATIIHHHRRQSLLRFFCKMADKQIARIEQDQIRRALHYL